MRALGRAAVAAAIMLVGVLAMGASPPVPSPPTSGPPLPVRPLSRPELAAKLLPTPRLFEVTTVIDGKPQGVAQLCQSAETMLRQRELSRAANHSARPPAAGCTHTFARRPDGGSRLEMTCDKAAGAPATSHSTTDTDGQMRDMRQHMEVTYEGPPRRTRVIDTRTIMKGDCPAGLPPGAVRTPDGGTRDLAAAAARR